MKTKYQRKKIFLCRNNILSNCVLARYQFRLVTRWKNLTDQRMVKSSMWRHCFIFLLFFGIFEKKYLFLPPFYETGRLCVGCTAYQLSTILMQFSYSLYILQICRNTFSIAHTKIIQFDIFRGRCHIFARWPLASNLPLHVYYSPSEKKLPIYESWNRAISFDEIIMILQRCQNVRLSLLDRRTDMRANKWSTWLYFKRYFENYLQNKLI